MGMADEIEATVRYLIEVQGECTRQEVMDAVRADDPDVWTSQKQTSEAVRSVIARMRQEGQIEVVMPRGHGLQRYTSPEPMRRTGS